MANKNIDGIIYKFTVENIANLNRFQSEIVYIRGHPWWFVVQKLPYQAMVEIPCLNLFICTEFEDEVPDKAINTYAAVELLTSSIGCETHQVYFQNTYTSHHPSWGRTNFIRWDDLMKPENGFIVDGACTFQIVFHTSPMHDINDGSFMELKTIQKCCDESREGKFRLIVKKFNEFPGVCSPKLVLHNIPWQISVARFNGPKGNFLRLKLYAASKLRDWNCDINMNCKLISFDKNVQSVQQQMDCHFIPTASESLDLIEWSKLIDVKNRFIENGTIIIEVDLEVSKVEDIKMNAVKKCCLTRENLNSTFIMSKWMIAMECPVCMENLFGCDASITSCGHMFCKGCIVNSLQRKKECPTCKKAVKVADLRPMFFPETKLIPINTE